MAARDQNGTKMTQRMMLFDDGCRERHEVLCDHRIVKPGGATRRAQITQTCRVSQFSGERQTCSEPRYCKLVPRRAPLVHGFAMLLLDDRLKQLTAKLPPGVNEMAFLPAILSAALPKT
jgi:hypothetical protein